MSRFEKGVKIFLKMTNRDDSKDEIMLVSYLISELPNNDILIHSPLYNGKPYPFVAKEPVNVSFTDKNGRYEFWSIATKRITRGESSYIKLHITSEISHAQYRNDFRIDAHFEGKMTVLSKDGNKKEEYDIEYFADNISAGGMSVFTMESCKTGRQVRMSIVTEPDKKVVEINAEIVRCRRTYQGGYRYHIGMRFDTSDRNLIGDIVRYVYHLQYQLLKKRRENMDEDEL